MNELIAVVYDIVRGIATQITNAVTSINSNTNTARDNINTTTNAARDNVKAHVSAAVQNVIAVRQSYVAHASVAWIAGSGGGGGSLYADIPIGAVNAAKTQILPAKVLLASNGTAFLTYKLISNTAVRVELGFGTSIGAGQSAVVSFALTEFY